eukprot:comp9638_c0_seq1/m.4659 comp9638_c0_seq1/g.4659  ORF comp9638_c0_seq1/g.4659 comp9638_c0_seq1/m.4659 type:complete len:260 (-) comp9638_c0_seq1:199-978(-)
MAAFCEVSGYKVYAVDIGGAIHYLYGREHQAKNEEHPEKKTLFVANIAPVFDEGTVKHIFQSFGSVKHVQISSLAQQRHHNTLAKKLYHPNPDAEDSVLFAHVVFKSEKGLAAALQVDDQSPVIDASEHVKGASLAEWVEECRAVPRMEHLEDQVDAAMRLFEAREEQRREQLEAQRNQPDEEGWITVSYGRKRSEIDAEPDKEKEKKKQEKKEKVMLNFYRWQQREARRDQIADLRRKFEEDKKKIASMRQARKFKPY